MNDASRRESDGARRQNGQGVGRHRGKMRWKQEIVLERGDVVCKITSALFNGTRKGYSIEWARRLRGGGARTETKFLRPDDLTDQEDLILECRAWLDDDKEQWTQSIEENYQGQPVDSE